MKTKGTVSLEGIEFFARHGIYDFEREKGNTFWVDVFITKHYEENELNSLDDTIDYEKVYVTVAKVMQEPENLLETVAHKIIVAITESTKGVENIKLKIKKNKPPIANSIMEYSAFELEWNKD